MSFLASLRPDNPVLTKELRVRMRGARAFWILFGYLTLVSALLWFSYFNWLSSVQTSGVGTSESGHIGDQLFRIVLATQYFLAFFITPAITSGSLTVEREQQTIDLLLLTRLPRRSIIAGKLLSGVFFTALLLVSSLPLVSICFMLGSIDPMMILSSYMTLLIGSILIGALGLMWSSVARTTTHAVIYTYLTTAGLLGAIVGPIVGAAGGGSIGACALLAIRASWIEPRVPGASGFEGMGFCILASVAGLLLSALSTARLESGAEKGALTVRTLTLLLLGVQLMGIYVWWIDTWYHVGTQAVQFQIEPPLVALTVTSLLLLFLTTVFVTGEIVPEDSRRIGRFLASGWTRRAFGRGSVASGLPFVLLAATLGLTLYASAFALHGKAQDVGRSGAVAYLSRLSATAASPPLSQPLPGRVRTQWRTTGGNLVPPASAGHFSGDFPQAALVIFVSVLGMSALCLLLSATLQNRWAAWLLATLFLCVLLLTPELGMKRVRYGVSDVTAAIQVNLTYLNPAAAIGQMGTYTEYPLASILWLGNYPVWKVLCVAWTLIGLFSLLLMHLILRGRELRQVRA